QGGEPGIRDYVRFDDCWEQGKTGPLRRQHQVRDGNSAGMAGAAPALVQILGEGLLATHEVRRTLNVHDDAVGRFGRDEVRVAKGQKASRSKDSRSSPRIRILIRRPGTKRCSLAREISRRSPCRRAASLAAVITRRPTFPASTSVWSA